MFKLFKKQKETLIYSPARGKVVELDKVPDEVFASRMIGDGIAVLPEDGIIKAPCDGKIIQIFPTNHAIGISSEEGLEILIHMGIDTVELKGEGYERLIEEEQVVKKGDPLIKMDLELIKEKGKAVITPIIITNMEKVKGFSLCNVDEFIEDGVIMKIKLK
ncbi:PTS sugar transporter subunit IIA [Vallitalea guaymasensis]|uniref:PTS glucose transporter subunit IIA n=1 Tax=Vallitalea guaymasensis TaxID=1185412 RepID=A0A8J8M9U5_9FIRM|nr:PTS glucose transporter subunit IIA [Vallitalea guaymasensis]QUH28994.1 PTS glucose transporter subunit IIA [Vallitalea guaymasensis]